MEQEVCKKLLEIEEKFLEIADLKIDLTVFPLKENLNQQVKTDKDKSNLFGEVFTPLWLVDDMILRAKDKLVKSRSSLDLCAGYGQFTVRMLRFMANHKRQQKKVLKVDAWLRKHYISELQHESAYKLLYIFGTGINLLIGDASKLNELEDTDNGILVYGENKWHNITKETKKWFGKPTNYEEANEREFCKRLKSFLVGKKSVQLRMEFFN